MSASILERIESHQIRILAGQDEIVATVRGLVGRVDDHDRRIMDLEASAGAGGGLRLLAMEQRQARQERRMRLLLWIFPAACVAAAAAGAWAALHL